ncbi:cupin domain-containing protein [Capnocytophaga canis]|uniref:cupin domain-containing protein n=1 Tax=Capnocytophaga canis TaxID=1848903 RepID=UPI0021750C6D|nr:cupin domain-containing protein [Capnocytophaga canis]
MRKYPLLLVLLPLGLQAQMKQIIEKEENVITDVMTASMLKDVTYKDDKPNVEVILETEFTKEVRIAFKEGQIMKRHKAPRAIVVQVLEGKINFEVGETIYQLNKGDFITLKATIVHELKALENSVVRLSLSKYETQEIEKSKK